MVFVGAAEASAWGSPSQWDAGLWLGALGVLPWVWGCLCELRPCSRASGGLSVSTALKCVSPHQSPAAFLLRKTRKADFSLHALYFILFSVFDWFLFFFPSRKPEGMVCFIRKWERIYSCAVSTLVHFHSTVPQSEGWSWDKAAALGKILLSSAGMEGCCR